MIEATEQKEKLTSDFIQIEDYTITLEKYRTDSQKQQICQQLSPIIKKMNQTNPELNGLNLEQVSLVYDHIKQYSGDVWNVFRNPFFPLIYRCIPSIYFFPTRIINLSFCNIISIESFAYLNAPNLITFELYGNKIRSIKPLAKNYHIRQMKTFTLYMNVIVDMNILHRSKFDQMWYLELETTDQNNVFCQDLVFMYKLPVKNKGYKVRIWYDPDKRIMQPIEKMINKYEELQRY